jgi:ribonucleoside-triphosphate reductase
MQNHGTLEGARAGTNGHARKPVVYAPAVVAEGWTCKKRDGSVVPFDVAKVEAALARCFDSVGENAGCAEGMTAAIVRRVVNTLAADKTSCPDVEHVQRVVIQQLWAEGLFLAAEHYQNYREERRKAREAHVDPEAEARITADAEHFKSPLEYFQFLDKYARWDDTKKRRETWRECCDRVLGYFRRQPQLAALREDEWAALGEAMYARRVSPAMRIVQMAGPTLDRCNTGAFNCWTVAVDDLVVFPEVLYLLMQGGGVGFSVEGQFVDELPRVRKQKGGSPAPHAVGDSTEGWCDALKAGVYAWAAGEDVEFDYSLVRPRGARLKTKGGRASGPEPLRALLAFVRTVFLKRQGKYLTPRDCHDVMCMIGKIVQVGGVRRSSLISLSDLDDAEMRDAKSGSWWNTSPWLDQSNNTAVYEEKPDAVTFMTEWLALAKSGSGERGILNRCGILKQIPKRRKKAKFLVNPCGEAINRPNQACNLSIAVARADDTPETLEAKVVQAAVYGTLQSTLTNFAYVRPVYKENCDEERLLGVDINGQMDCPLLRPNAPGREALLRHLKEVAVRTNAALAARLGIPASAAVTVVKPSGNSGVFFGCSSGMHPRWSRYQVRRVRCERYGPMAALLVHEGVPHEVDPHNEGLFVFDFLPEPAPEGTPTRHDLTAVEQFANWLVWKTCWTEHNPSVTITVAPDEWLELGAEVYKHFDKIGGVSFLPKDGGTYRLAPNEELTREDYEARRAVFPRINWAKLSRFEGGEDHTTSAQEAACGGGACALN